MPASPETFHEWLKGQLEQSLATKPDDHARVIHLVKEWGSWSERYRRFAATGRQPFGEPHPVYGPMSATDFLIVLGMIDGARSAIERRMTLQPAE
jgi:hypothetical protein